MLDRPSQSGGTNVGGGFNMYSCAKNTSLFYSVLVLYRPHVIPLGAVVLAGFPLVGGYLA